LAVPGSAGRSGSLAGYSRGGCRPHRPGFNRACRVAIDGPRTCRKLFGWMSAGHFLPDHLVDHRGTLFIAIIGLLTPRREV